MAPPLPTWHTYPAPAPAGDHSPPIIRCQPRRLRKKFSCLASLSSSSHRTNNVWIQWFTAAKGGRGLFSIISDKFVPFPVPHQSWPGEGHQKQTRYQDISSKFVSQSHTCGRGGALYTIYCNNTKGDQMDSRCNEENSGALKNALSLPIYKSNRRFYCESFKTLACELIDIYENINCQVFFMCCN